MTSRSDVRAGPRFWGLLTLGLLLFSASFSALSPGGEWENRIFGSTLFGDYDPGGWYIPSAHQLFESGGHPLFPGHPGAPLSLLLRALQEIHYGFLGPNDLDFTEFTARHLGEIWLTAKVSMTFLHLLSFFFVYRLARRLVNERAAVLATVGYATSLPVFYYLSRISVEPLMVGFFATTLISIAVALDRARDNRMSSALGFAVLSGSLAVSGMVTKFAFLGPLPFFGLLYVIVGVGARDPMVGWRWALRAKLGTAFALGATLTAVGYLQIIHVGEFVTYWTHLASVPQPSSLGNWRLFLPSLEVSGIFQLCEFLFIVLGVIGWIRYLARASRRRTEALWLTLYLVYCTGLWAFRVSQLDFRVFHYFFLPTVGLAIFFGFLGDSILARWQQRRAVAAGWFGVLVLVVLVHGFALVAVTDSRIDDVRQFRSGPVFDMARSLGRDDHVEIAWATAPGWYRSGWSERSLTLFSALRSIDDCPPGLCFSVRPQRCPIRRNIDVIECNTVPPRLYAEFNSLFRLVKMKSDGRDIVLPGLGRVRVVRGVGGATPSRAP